MTTQEKIANIVQKHSQAKGVPGPADNLFEDGYLDSFALADMVGDLEAEFGITIPDGDLSPRKFESMERIERYIESKL